MCLRKFVVLALFMLFLGLEVAALHTYGAVGSFVQDGNPYSDPVGQFFEDDDTGLFFDGVKTYRRGDFMSYTWLDGILTETVEAGLLMDGTFDNVYLLAYNNLSSGSLGTVSHEMEEQITLDSDLMYYYESNLGTVFSEELEMALERNAVSYRVDVDCIPLTTIRSSEVGILEDEGYRQSVLNSSGNGTYVFVDTVSTGIVDGKITVAVNVTNVIDLDSAQFDLSFDSSVLQVESVSGGESGEFMWDANIITSVDNTGGTLRVVCNVLGLSGVNGSGSMAEITFDVVGGVGGSSDLNLSGVVLGDVTASLIEVDNTFGETVTIVEDISYIDFEYRGKILFFGEEYYVKDIEGNQIMYVVKGKLSNVTNEGFTAEYNGYKFRVDSLVYSGETVADVLLDVQKPDGTTVQVQPSRTVNGVVDNLEIALVSAGEEAGFPAASIMVYDLESQVLLEEGEYLEIEGQVKTDWEIEFNAATGTCGIGEYGGMDNDVADLLSSIEITYNHALDDGEALEEGESLMFPNNFRLTFKGYKTSDYWNSLCSGAGEGNITVEQGDLAYQVAVSFTGNDNNRYDGVRLDEGPFHNGDLFILNGILYTYDNFDVNLGGDSGDVDDTVEITLDPQISGNSQKVGDIARFCDPDDGGDPDSLTVTGLSCMDIGENGVITLRELALIDAMDDDEPNSYENDRSLTLNAYDIFLKEDVVYGAYGDFDIIFDDSDNSIIFAQGFWDSTSETVTDEYISLNPNMIGTFDDFDVDGYELEMFVRQESGVLTAADLYTSFVSTYTDDDDDVDDTLIVFNTADGDVVIDMTDRDFNGNTDSDYSTSLFMYQAAGDDIVLDNDEDMLLITPEGGDEFTIEWGSDGKIEAVELCHPKDDVDVTYFIGTVEEETFVDDGDEIEDGDANGDGVVNVFDITKIERAVAGIDSPSSGADANGDGVVNIFDITMIERMVAGLA